METERTEEYLEALYKRQVKERPVTTSALASDLGVSQPAVTDMLRTLVSRGLVDYRANKGATLTKTGEERALAVIRRHRLWERFLTDVLGMQWDKVHEEACRLEHATSPDIEKGLSELLGDVETCPHGHSIPDASGKIRLEKDRPIAGFRPGQQVRIVKIADENPLLLRKIEKLGLRPGATVNISKRHRDGSLEIVYAGESVLMEEDIASVLLADKAPTPAPSEEKTEIPLVMLPSGETAVIKTCAGGRASMGRCLSMGFTPGSLIKMVENYNRGPVLVRLHNTDVAIGRGLAEKISVVPKTTEC
ncbi:MAG: FeoA domain-containing protein [Dehalococcoidia bacterium]|nr:FeoA domain-containing protein [Dehalococcoidia bacterium]